MMRTAEDKSPSVSMRHVHIAILLIGVVIGLLLLLLTPKRAGPSSAARSAPVGNSAPATLQP
jgi:hypothetical protein